MESKTLHAHSERLQNVTMEWYGATIQNEKKKTESTFITCKNQKATVEKRNVERETYERRANKQQLCVIYNGTKSFDKNKSS